MTDVRLKQERNLDFTCLLSLIFCLSVCCLLSAVCYLNPMTDPFIAADEEHIKREKARGRELRNSQWWKRRRSTGICYYCGRKFKADELTMDHLIPIVRGGRSVAGNVVPACKDCNSKKKFLLPTEWEEYLSSLKKED